MRHGPFQDDEDDIVVQPSSSISPPPQRRSSDNLKNMGTKSGTSASSSSSSNPLAQGTKLSFDWPDDLDMDGEITAKQPEPKRLVAANEQDKTKGSQDNGWASSSTSAGIKRSALVHGDGGSDEVHKKMKMADDLVMATALNSSSSLFQKRPDTFARVSPVNKPLPAPPQPESKKRPLFRSLNADTPPTPTPKRPGLPFMQDDDDSDNDVMVVDKPSFTGRTLKPSPKDDGKRKEAQRLESERLRKEAVFKKEQENDDVTVALKEEPPFDNTVKLEQDVEPRAPSFSPSRPSVNPRPKDTQPEIICLDSDEDAVEIAGARRESDARFAAGQLKGFAGFDEIVRSRESDAAPRSVTGPAPASSIPGLEDSDDELEGTMQALGDRLGWENAEEVTEARRPVEEEEEAEEAEAACAEQKRREQDIEQKKAEDAERAAKAAAPRRRREEQEAAARREAEAKKREEALEAGRKRQEERAKLVAEAEERFKAEAEKNAKRQRNEEAYRKKQAELAAASASTTPRPVHGSHQMSDAEQARQRRIDAMAERNARNRQFTANDHGDVSVYAGTEDTNPDFVPAAERNRDRIQALKKRNARNRQANEEDDLFGEASEVAEPLPKGPVSLNSLTGTARLKAAQGVAKPIRDGQSDGKTTPNGLALPSLVAGTGGPVSLRAAGERGMDVERQKPFRPSSMAPVDELLPEDVKLFYWRNGGNEWQDIIEDFEGETGKRMSEDALRRRFRKVQAVLEGVELEPGLLQKVMTGDEEARKVLNARVSGVAVEEIRLPSQAVAASTVSTSVKDKLGEVLPEDISLMIWKDDGNVWSDIVDDWEELTGKRRREDALRSRYRLIKEAFKSIKPDAALLTKVMSNDAEARQNLNRRIHGTWPIPQKDKPRPANASTPTRTPYQRKLGAISAEDIQVSRWKNSGMSFHEICKAYEQTTGKKRSDETLRKRYRHVRDALAAVDVSEDLLDLVENGDQAACSRLNQLVSDSSSSAPVPPSAPVLGEILTEDVMIVKWKAGGMTYEDVAAAFEKATGSFRSVSYISSRHKAVKAVLDNLDLNPQLLEDVANGDDDAKRRLNVLVHGRRPVDNPLGETGGSKSKPVPTKAVLPRQPPIAAKSPAAVPAYGASSTSNGERKSETPPTSPRHAVSIADIEQPRPSTSGKTMNAAAIRHYLEMLVEQDQETTANEEAEKMAVEAARKTTQEQWSSQDYLHFEYYVEHREVVRTTDVEDEDEALPEHELWMILGGPLTDLHEANRKAAEQALVAHNPQLHQAILSQKRNLAMSNDDNGCAYFDLEFEGGKVQTRVKRSTRAYQDHIRPRTTLEWLTRKCYVVRQRTVTKSRDIRTEEVKEVANTDELFGEGTDEETIVTKEVFVDKEVVKEESVDAAVFTDLDLANDRAIKHFVGETFDSLSINLTVRDVEKAELIRAYTQKLEQEKSEQDREVYAQYILEEAGDSLEVWVEEATLKGPRNM